MLFLRVSLIHSKKGGEKGQFDNIEKMEEKLGFNAHVDINLSLNLNKIFITISCN